MLKKVLIGLALGLGASALVLLLGRAGWTATAEMRAYDWRIRLAAALRQGSATNRPHPDIVLVEINDAAIADLSTLVGRWPWPRAVHALLIDYLQRGSPKVIVFDVGFWEPERESTYPFLGETITSAMSDAALADAVRQAGNVIFLADAINPGLEGAAPGVARWRAPAYRLGPAIEPRPVVTPPYDALAGTAAGLGHNFLVIDPDGPARRLPPFIRQGDRYMPSLGVAAALAAEGIAPGDVVLGDGDVRMGSRRLPLVPVEVPDVAGRRTQQTMLINYLAPPHVFGVPPYRSFAVNDLLRSEGQLQSGEKPDVDPASFAGKIVFVGATAAGLHDVFQTPFGESVMPGIQLHANVTDSILSDRFLRLAPDWSRLLALLGGAALVGVLVVTLPFSLAAGLTALLAVAWVVFSVVAFRGGLVVAVAQPLLAAAIALFGATAYRYFVEDAEKRKVSRLFGRYVSKDVYSQLMANPALAELGGRRRDMTVLFSDIRGFTSVTEKGNPEALVAQLNEYFSAMVGIVFRHHGTVDKFVGDMVMALFSAPVDDERHPDQAVSAAVEMVAALGELNRKWAAEGRPALDIGIGVNSGEMIAGNIGSSSIMSYTVIGDNVNLAARLESLNKDYATRIIISGATRQRLQGQFETRPLGDVVVKGKTQPVAIVEVIVPSPLPAAADPASALQAEERLT